jgi:hypothetical protein
VFFIHILNILIIVNVDFGYNNSVLEPYYDSSTYRWPTGGTLSYTIQSSWGYPRTLSLRLASVNRHESYVERSAADEIRQASEVGYAYIDLSQLWTKVDISGRGHTSVIATIPLWSLADKSDFDNSGYLPEDESFQFQVRMNILTIIFLSFLIQLLTRCQSLSFKELKN